MLAYLSKFYDIWQEAADQSQEVDPERAVELLEEILGLDEDNFVAFRAKAQLLANQGPTAEKRERPATGSSSGGPQPLRRKLQAPSDGSPTVPFTETTVPFTETRSRAPPRGPAPRQPIGSFYLNIYDNFHQITEPCTWYRGCASAAPQHNSRFGGDGEQLEEMGNRSTPGRERGGE